MSESRIEYAVRLGECLDFGASCCTKRATCSYQGSVMVCESVDEAHELAARHRGANFRAEVVSHEVSPWVPVGEQQ